MRMTVEVDPISRPEPMGVTSRIGVKSDGAITVTAPRPKRPCASGPNAPPATEETTPSRSVPQVDPVGRTQAGSSCPLLDTCGRASDWCRPAPHAPAYDGRGDRIRQPGPGRVEPGRVESAPVTSAQTWASSRARSDRRSRPGAYLSAQYLPFLLAFPAQSGSLSVTHHESQWPSETHAAREPQSGSQEHAEVEHLLPASQTSV